MVATTTSEAAVAPENLRPSLSRGRRSTFYLVTSLIIAAVVLLGFEHTFFLRPLLRSRLEQQRFIWPRMSEGDTVSMSGGELNQLLDGFDVWAQGHRELQLKRVG